MAAKVYAIVNFQVTIPRHFCDDLACSPIINGHQRLVTQRFGEAYFSGDTSVIEIHMLRPYPQGNL